MSGLEDRLSALESRLSDRASDLESRLSSRYGSSRPAGGATRSAAGPRPAPAADAKAAPVRGGGARHGLFVGVNAYPRMDAAHQLEGCVNDARGLRDACVELGGWLPENAVVLENATCASFSSALAAMAQTARSGDLAVVSFSGHGGVRAGRPDDDFVFSLHEADWPEGEFRKALAAFDRGVKIVVVVDACFSGAVAGSGFLDRLQFRNVGWITASTGWQTSDDGFRDRRDNGFLTGALLEGWRNGGAAGMSAQMKGGSRAAVPPVSPGSVTFLDLAVFAAHSWRYLHPNHQQPQYHNESLLGSVLAGRIGQPAVRPMEDEP